MPPSIGRAPLVGDAMTQINNGGGHCGSRVGY